MSSPLTVSPFMYGDLPYGGALTPIIITNVAPVNSVNLLPAGYLWLSDLNLGGSGNMYFQSGNTLGQANWILIASGGNSVTSVLGTANQITAITASGVVTLSIPATFIAPGTITAASGAITATNGNLVLGTAGNKISIATGANASVGVSGPMIAGAITISTTACTVNSVILYSRKTLGTTAGDVSITTQIAGSFTLTSSAATETSTFNYLIIN